MGLTINPKKLSRSCAVINDRLRTKASKYETKQVGISGLNFVERILIKIRINTAVRESPVLNLHEERMLKSGRHYLENSNLI